MKKKIAIVGASYLQLPLVQKAKDMGIETHCFAWEEGAVCKNYCDYFYPISVTEKELILEKCKMIGIDGITTIATDLSIPTISFVAEKLNLVSNSIEVSKNTTNKVLMRDRFLLNKVSSPRYMKINNDEVVFPEYLKFPLIVKPVDRSGSRGVSKVTNKEELVEAIKIAMRNSLCKEIVIEEYIEGKEVSVETISWQGKHYILAITDKITTGAPHFVEVEHHQPSMLSEEVILKIKEETIKALDSLAIYNGAGHTEIKIDKNKTPYVIEVGARMGGDFIGSHLVKLSTGYDFLKGVIEVSLNKFTKPIVKHKSYTGIYFLSEETKEIYTYFLKENDFEVIKELQNTTLKPLLNSNDRSGYLIYSSNSRIVLR